MWKKLEGSQQVDEQSIHSPGPHSKTENSQTATRQRFKDATAARRAKPHDSWRQNCDKKNEVRYLNKLIINGSLKCFYSTASSLFHKLDELKLRAQKYDVIAITETWAKDDMTDAELSIDGFVIFTSDRKGRLGGGVLLYVRSSIPVQYFCEASNIGFEKSVWCIAELGMSSLIIGVCYRSPSSEELNNDRLLQVLDTASKHCHKGASSPHLLLVGDFIYPEISYNHFTVDASTDSSAYKFFSKTQDLSLSQCVHQHTRIRAGNAPSTLDYIFTDEAGLVDEIEYQAPIGKSNHVCLSWTTTVFDSDAKKPKLSTKRNFWKGNYSATNRELSEVNWDEVVGNGSMNDRWKRFSDLLNGLIEGQVPMCEENKKRKAKVITRQTIEQIKARNASWKEYRQCPSVDKFNTYKQIRNRVTRWFELIKTNMSTKRFNPSR